MQTDHSLCAGASYGPSDIRVCMRAQQEAKKIWRVDVKAWEAEAEAWVGHSLGNVNDGHPHEAIGRKRSRLVSPNPRKIPSKSGAFLPAHR